MDEYETQTVPRSEPSRTILRHGAGSASSSTQSNGKYEAGDGDAKLVELWAKEIVLQAKLIGAMKGTT